MKNLLAVLLTCLLALISCKNEKNAGEATVDTETSAENDTPLQKLAADLDGFWISDSYLSDIERTKSVYQSREYSKVGGLLGFSIYKDSLVTGTSRLLGFSGHEGGLYRPIKYNAAENRFDYDATRAGEFGDPIDFSLKMAGKNLLEIAHSKPSKQMDRYRKVGDKQDDLGLLDRELNRILFEGTYTDTVTGKKVIFSRDGKIEGMDHKNYRISYHFDALDFDAVYLWSGSEANKINQVEMHFKIDGTTIRLYSIVLNKDEMEYIVSKLPFAVLIKD